MSDRHPLGMRPANVPQGFPGRVSFVKSASKIAEAPHQVEREVCFCGRSNVGKSSLLNVLTNRKGLARVSQTPGRTRLINFFNVQDKVTFVDLPGYGWAKVSRGEQEAWGRTIEAYLDQRPQLAMALLLVDARRDIREEEQGLLAWFQERELPVLVVATKSDKIKPSQLGKRLKEIARDLGIPKRDLIPFSALSRKGREEILATILAVAAPEERPEGEGA